MRCRFSFRTLFPFLALAMLLGPAIAVAQEATPKLSDLIQVDSDAGDAPARDGSQAADSGSEEPGATPRSSVSAYFDAVGQGDYAQASDYLDLSRTRQDGHDLARHLEVVLDHTIWIDLDTLSSDPAGAQDDGLPKRQERIGHVTLGDREVPILLSRGPAGDPPEWRFASETVAQIPALYEAHGYGPLGTYLPDFFFDLRVLDLQLWQWIGLVTLMLVAGILSWAVASLVVTVTRHALRKRAGETSVDVALVVTGPARLVIGVAIFSATKHLLGLALTVVAVLDAVESLLLAVAMTWAALRLVDVFAGLVEARLLERGDTSAVALLPPGQKTLKAFAVIIGTLACLDSIGFNITAVLAGLGVGGIAVALAAQKTVENLFGGATLYADRPVRVGDFCRFGDKLGTVEEIGLRSTRVRTLDRTVVSIANAEFANMQLENFTRRDKIWYNRRIGLRYETTPDQLRYILVEVRKMLYAHPDVDPDPARIRFTNFGAYSLDLDIFAYVNVTEYGDFLEIAEDLNLRLMDIVTEAGSGFAFPSQTTYIEQGEPLDASRQSEVKEAVSKWRDERELYLPRFPEEKISELRNTLDFPPQGSPDRGDDGRWR